MTISRACYVTRDEVKRALDIKETARNTQQIDRAIETASENIDHHLHRKFFTEVTTKYFDWPNDQLAAPWKLWLDQNELADVTTSVPVLTSGGTVIPSANLLWGPVNYGPPFGYVEISLATSSAFSSGSTPQRAISIQGTFGYWTLTDPAGTLAASIGTTSVTTCTVSSGATPGVGDVITVDSEKMLVTDKTMTTSTQTQQGSGVGTASASDVTLAVTDGTKFSVDEIVLLDSERMLIVDISGNNLTVKRAWDGSVLATHSGATVFVLRSLTITRGAFGTTAATHNQGATVSTNRIPRLVKSLALAEASVQVMQETGAYSVVQGMDQTRQSGIGDGLAEKWDEAQSSYGRNVRQRVV